MYWSFRSQESDFFVLFFFVFFFLGGGVLDNLLQIQLRIIQKMTENRFMFVFLILNLAYNYVVVQFYPQFNFYFPLF